MPVLDVIREIIQQVILIVLIGTLIDMLLPNGRLQSLIRLVAGIFIMVAVLNPIMSLLHRSDWSQTLGAHVLPASKTKDYEEIRRQGEEIRQQSLSKAREEAKVRLERQVEAMATLKNGVKQASAQVALKAGHGEDLGIGHITLRLKAEPGKERSKETVAPVMVEPVIVDPDKPSGKSSPHKDNVNNEAINEETAKQLARSLSGLYGVPEERITVLWE